MPGKVNPTQSESMTMVCCQVFGNDVAINVISLDAKEMTTGDPRAPGGELRHRHPSRWLATASRTWPAEAMDTPG